LAIVGHDPDEAFRKLCRQENFRGYTFEALGEREEQSNLHEPNLPLISGRLSSPLLATQLVA
jgi:hypothetical protein